MQKNFNKNNKHINNRAKPKGGDVIKAIVKAKEVFIFDDSGARIRIDEVIKRNITNNYNLMQAIYSIIKARREFIFDDSGARIRIDEAIKKVR